MSRQYGFVIDLQRCIGCDTCVVGCKMEHGTPVGEFRLRVFDPYLNLQVEKPIGKYPELDMYWLPTMCHHCTEAPCADACPTRALWRRDDDGMVVLEKEKCVGCQRCAEECPYDALWFDDELGTADKCNMCEDRVGAGRLPTCQQVCPTRAIHFGDLNDPESNVYELAANRETRVLGQSAGAGPQILYLSPWPENQRMSDESDERTSQQSETGNVQ